MTTAAEVKKWVKPLLASHSNLALAKRLIVVKPIHHLLCAVLIDRTAYADKITPRWFVDHFFQPSRRFRLTWGGLLTHPRHGLNWICTEADNQSILLQEIERQALPALSGLGDLQSFMVYVSNNDFRHHLFDRPERKVVIDVTLGNLETARQLSRDFISKKSVEDHRLDDEDREHLRKVKALCKLLDRDDRAGMAQMLHDWEAETVRLMKLDHLWQPTPFPLEMG